MPLITRIYKLKPARVIFGFYFLAALFGALLVLEIYSTDSPSWTYLKDFLLVALALSTAYRQLSPDAGLSIYDDFEGEYQDRDGDTFIYRLRTSQSQISGLEIIDCSSKACLAYRQNPKLEFLTTCESNVNTEVGSIELQVRIPDATPGDYHILGDINISVKVIFDPHGRLSRTTRFTYHINEFVSVEED